MTAVTLPANRLAGANGNGNGHSNGKQHWFEKEMPGIWHSYGDGLYVGFVEFQPEQAGRIVEKYGDGNRPAIASQQRYLDSVVARCNFHVTGDTAVFDRKRKLRNARHRLTACKNAGKPIKTFVVVGVEPEAFRHMDQHSRRRLAHVLGIEGERDAAWLASATSMLYTFLKGNPLGRYGVSQQKAPPDMDEYVKLLEKHPGLRGSTTFIGSLPKPTIFSGYALAICGHYVFSRVDKGLADEMFSGMLNHQVPSGAKWKAVAWLTATLNDTCSATHKRKYPIWTIGSMLVRAWNALFNESGAKDARLRKGEALPEVAGWLYDEGKPIRPLTQEEVPLGRLAAKLSADGR